MTDLDAPGTIPRYSLPPQRGGSISRLVCWGVICVSIASIGFSNWKQDRRDKASTVTSQRVSDTLEMVGRYVVGAQAYSDPSAKSILSPDAMLPQLDEAAKSRADELGVIAVVAELDGASAALARLDKLQPKLANNADLQADAVALRQIYAGDSSHSLSNRARGGLQHDLGWFGSLALTFGHSATEESRAHIISTAKRTVIVMFIFISVIVVASVAGLGLLIFLLIRRVDGKLVAHYRRPTAGGGVAYLEAFAIYLGGITLASVGAHWLPTMLKGNLLVHLGIMVVPTLIALAWPLVRGESVAAGHWNNALGWSFGIGFFKEVGLGIVGYLAGIPVLIGGMGITFILIKLAHANPSHPIQHMLGQGARTTLLIFILASIYAPLTEETLFRGALFHSLRGRHGWTVSALASSFIFAAVHPQGWTVIPALMSIAIVFAAIREWRSTIISSAAAHCLHNTALITFAVFAMG